MENIFNRVLYVGMDYKVPKGGIASVLNTYSSFVRPFKFVRTHASELNRIQKIWYAASGYVMLVWKLMTDKDIRTVQTNLLPQMSIGIGFVPFYTRFGRKPQKKIE